MSTLSHSALLPCLVYCKPNEFLSICSTTRPRKRLKSDKFDLISPEASEERIVIILLIVSASLAIGQVNICFQIISPIPKIVFKENSWKV